MGLVLSINSIRIAMSVGCGFSFLGSSLFSLVIIQDIILSSLRWGTKGEQEERKQGKGVNCKNQRDVLVFGIG